MLRDVLLLLRSWEKHASGSCVRKPLYNGCHSVSFVWYIFGTKFEEDQCNIPRSILTSVLKYCFSAISVLICMLGKLVAR